MDLRKKFEFLQKATRILTALLIFAALMCVLTGCANVVEWVGSIGKAENTQVSESSVSESSVSETLTFETSVSETSFDDIAETSENETDAETTQEKTSETSIADVEVTTCDETAAETVPDGETVVDKTDILYSYEDMRKDVMGLSEKYPEIFSYEVIGRSLDGRDIFACTVGNKNAENKLLVTAAIHAKEYLSALISMMNTENILANYDSAKYQDKTYSEIFENCAMILIPMINPDGVTLAEDGVSGINDKSLVGKVQKIYSEWKEFYDNVDIDGFIASNWKTNARGVDLNRNYPISAWESIKTGVIAPCFKNYKGDSAGSEPETRAVMDYVNKTSGICALLSMHTAGHIIYWDCGQPSGNVRNKTYDLALLVRDVTDAAGNKYKVSYDQNIDASLTDWCVLEKSIPSVTVEIGKVAYPVEDSEITPAFNETRELFAAVAYAFGN